jgi:proteasome lid subunit RPN8/RPN11
MGTPPFAVLQMAQKFVDGMVADALAERPNECCGFFAGSITSGGVGRVEQRYRLPNEAASPVEFHSGGHELFEAHRDIDRRQMTLLAIYHSHPKKPAVPSKLDRERNFYEESIVHLIVSLASEPPSVRAWWITTENCREATLEIIP